MPDYILEDIASHICSQKNLSLIAPKGFGAFKETYHVKTSSGQDEALKIFKDANVTQRTDREVQAMIDCSHPCVGSLKEFSKVRVGDKEYLYFVEEYLSGGTLGERLQEGAIIARECTVLGRNLIDAVEHIASKQLVHRDIKPENIMFRAGEESPVIVDFGLVRCLEESSLTPTWLVQGPGTPLYASPEQLNNEKDLIDWRSDQFSLGLVLAQCLLGYHPYAGPSGTPHEAVERMSTKQQMPEESKNILVENGFEAIVKMLEPWPVERYRKPDSLIAEWNI